MNIKLGSYDVLHSGSVIEIKGLPIIVEVSKTFKFIFQFVDNQTVFNSPKISTEVKGNSLIINLIDFFKSGTNGNVEPMLVATYHGKNLYLMFRVSRFTSELPRSLSFTFYLGELINARR
jgi:hypothetical protein